MRHVAILLCAALAGCSGSVPLPELHRVTGFVKKAGRPVRGGAVRFVPATEASVFAINSPVADDGTYTLETVLPGGERRPGAPAGVYRVTYTAPEPGGSGPSSATPAELPGLVTVGGGENLLTLNLPPM
jgi:hypothetical protein